MSMTDHDELDRSFSALVARLAPTKSNGQIALMDRFQQVRDRLNQISAETGRRELFEPSTEEAQFLVVEYHALAYRMTHR
jgi:hypothetical protein